MTDFLFPEFSPLDELGQLASYFQRIKALMIPQKTDAFAVCLPSFEPEWAVCLVRSRREKSIISVSVADADLWTNESVSISRFQEEVTSDFAELFAETMISALRTVANVNGYQSGLDGVTYHFVASDPENGRISGQVWSPRPNSVSGRLVGVKNK